MKISLELQNKILQYYLNNDKNIDIKYKNVDFHLNSL